MLRRTFFKWTSSSWLASLLPRFARAQATALAGPDAVLLNEIALVALPASLGREHILHIASEFQDWVRNYHPGADAGYGYGITRLRVLGPDPSVHYAEQFRQLIAAARAKGSEFSQLSDADKRSLLERVLTQAGVKALPPQPNGKCIVSDLLSFFYNSSQGEDFLYNAAIKREDCRGLASSGKRPARLS